MPTDGTPITMLTEAHDGQSLSIFSHTGTTISGTLKGSWPQSAAYDGEEWVLVLLDGWPIQRLPGSYTFIPYTH